MARKGSRAPEADIAIRVEATTAAPARARAAVTRWAADNGIGGEVLGDLRLLVTEVVTNAVLHGSLEGQDEIELTVECRGNRVHVHVHDPGEGFDEFLPIPSGDDVSGRGLYVVHQVASSWGVDRGPPFGIWFELERP